MSPDRGVHPTALAATGPPGRVIVNEINTMRRVYARSSPTCLRPRCQRRSPTTTCGPTGDPEPCKMTFIKVALECFGLTSPLPDL